MRISTVLGLSGSLRRNSANTAVLLAAQRLAPAELRLELYAGLATLPAYNPDIEAAGLPYGVAELRAHVAQADALLIACPEYAHGVPGAFKNLLDWLVGGIEFPHKPVLVLNTSARGSHHAQDALLEILRTMSARLIVPDAVPVPLPATGCTVENVLADGKCRARLQAVIARLAPHRQ